MTAMAPLIPENAPFSEEQRAWLNGFFAGVFSLDAGTDTTIADAAGDGVLSAAADPLDDGDDGDAPWHDQTLPLEKRMELAEGRPLRRRMMAAMGQQDCGQCGYSCEDYANALFLGEESKLNLCVPGSKPTLRMLKKLNEELDAAGTTSVQTKTTEEPGAAGSRDRPVFATFTGATRLTEAGSGKETNHIEISFEPGDLSYEVGDSLGVCATNDAALADAIIHHLDAAADSEVGDGNGHSRTLRDALIEDVSLSPAPDELFTLLAGLANDETQKRKLLAMAEGEDPDGDLDSLDILGALEKTPDLKPQPKALIAVLEPLQPRLYSISSSPRADPATVALTVDAVRYDIGGRTHKGLASCFLAERVTAGDTVPVYVQKAHGFALPVDGGTPIVMVGPGTGVAPFRAFLQDRLATRATGRAWLFFGHRHEKTDFFYRDELEGFLAAGTLTKLSTAWSRDGKQKTYVQDRMREQGLELFRWLEGGAHFYVCGDAGRMAADVDRTLREIVAEHGGLSPEDADGYVDALTGTGRYQRDVY